MKKTVLFALPLVALVFAFGCKKQEAPVAEQPVVEQPAAVAAPAATPAPDATPAPATTKKGK